MPSPCVEATKLSTGISACKEPDVPTPIIFQMCELFFDRSAFQNQYLPGIQFIQYNINIIRANTGGHDRYSFFANIAGMGNKFTVLIFEFYGVKMFAYFLYPVGIANGNNSFGNFFRTQIQMVNSATGIDDQF